MGYDLSEMNWSADTLSAAIKNPLPLGMGSVKENIVNNGDSGRRFFMKAKRISAWIIAVSLCMTNSGLVYAAENTGVEESSIQVVQEEDSIKEKKDEEPAAECVSEDVQAEISNENELSRKITTETENVPENGTQEQHDWEGKLYSDGTAEITKYTGSDKDVVIPSTIEGHTVTSLEQNVFYNNTTVETIHIPATVTFMGRPGDVMTTTFKGATSLRSITVEEGNPVYFSIDGVLFMYAATDRKPMLMVYPASKDGASYYIPKNVGNICDYAFSETINLNKIVVPENIKFLFISAFNELSNKDIIFCHTEPSQIKLSSGFTWLENCRIIVKNQEMKDTVKNSLVHEPTVNVLLESELSAEERNAYLTPATDLTFADGSRTKNITLEPEENCTIDYQLFPEDTTDVVTWESSDDSIAKVECVNGKVTVTGEANGECVITGTVHDQYTVNLNVSVKRSVTKIDMEYGFNLNPERIVSDMKNRGSLTLNIYPYDAKYRENVIWESSDPSVISVKKGSEGVCDKYYYHTADWKVYKPGEATITAKYTDKETKQVISRSIQLKFTKAIRECSAQAADCTYTGKSLKPEVIIKDGSVKLKQGTDYTISYSDNTKPGTGKAIIKGTGNYTGETVAYFEIQKKDSTRDSGEKDQKTDQKKDNTTEKSGQKITGISSSYKKAYNSSFTLKPKAKGKITYKSSNTKVATVNSKGKVKIKGTGKVTITITAKETSAYKKQTKKVTIYAVPGKRDIKKLSSGKKKLTVQWKKDNRSDGYQVQYSTDKKFKKNVKNVVIGKKQTTKQTIKKLKTGKKYYVRIRSYKKISGKKYYGTWSSKKTVKVK